MSFITKILIATLFVMFVVPMAGIAMLQATSSYKMATFFAELEKRNYGIPTRKNYSKGKKSQKDYFRRP